MKAGSTVWHESRHCVHEPLRVFHLWVEQPVVQGERTTTSDGASPRMRWKRTDP